MWPVNLCHDFRYGKIMYNQLDQFIGRSLRLYGEYSQGEADIFEQIVKPGHIVVEAGANIGSHTIHLAQLAGDQGQVWAFEPQRLGDRFGRLSRNGSSFSFLPETLRLTASRTSIACKNASSAAASAQSRFPCLT